MSSYFGFGTFQVVDRAATEGRNPRTGEKIAIAASRQPKFKAGVGTEAGCRRQRLVSVRAARIVIREQTRTPEDEQAGDEPRR